MMKLRRTFYLGIFGISMATLMLEILLTRIFSVTMWYHFAYLAIAIAMLGLTLGAFWVYFKPEKFSTEKIYDKLAYYSLGFALSTPLAFGIHVLLPFEPGFHFVGIVFPIFTFLLLAVPFFCSGVVITLVLTKFKGIEGKAYAADLVGAAGGCVIFFAALEIFSAPEAVLITSILGTLAALLFQPFDSAILKLFIISLLLPVIMLGANSQWNFLELKSVKGEREGRAIVEKWNAYSRIKVFEADPENEEALGWGMSDKWKGKVGAKQCWLKIDGTAGTVITEFDGDIDELEFLKYDIVNFAHHLKQDANVLVIGVGGGRDLLSALVFDQRKVTGVEYNRDILDLLRNEFYHFTGKLSDHPKVELVEEEARVHLNRSSEKYDIIQVSMIDTWAATAAGALALTENSLYTKEAWQSFFQRLTPNGILTFSRWYFPGVSGETYRLAALASAALRAEGIQNPADHFIMIAKTGKNESYSLHPFGVGTMLLKKTPFIPAELDLIRNISAELGFEIVFGLNESEGNEYAEILNAEPGSDFFENYALDISAPEDDRPFFFHLLRLKDIFNADLRHSGGMDFNMKAISVLGIHFIFALFILICFLFVPFFFRSPTQHYISDFPKLLYFILIGIAFMLVEISQMQKLILILGNPAYGLSVILFSLLVGAGLGAWLQEKVSWPAKRWVLVMLVVLLSYVVFGGTVFSMLSEISKFVLIALTFLILIPLGMAMGMAMPIGLKWTHHTHAEFSPWLWGINGLATVFGAVFATILSLSIGINMTLYFGVFLYCCAMFIYLRSSRQHN